MVIETFLIVDYTLLVLNQGIISVSLKIWAWLQLGHTQNMGVVAAGAPLLTISKLFKEGFVHLKDLLDFDNFLGFFKYFTGFLQFLKNFYMFKSFI